MITQPAVAGNSETLSGRTAAGSYWLIQNLAMVVLGIFLPLFRLSKRQECSPNTRTGADKALYEKVPTADLERG